MPPGEKGSQEKKSKRGGGAPHCSHHCSDISPLYCDGQALPQIGDRLGFPGGLFKAATQLSLEPKVSDPKGPALSMATGVKS